MTGESLAADTLAIVSCVHTSVFPKVQRRWNVNLGARSWVLLGYGDCPRSSHGGEGGEGAQALAQHKETSSNWDLLEGTQSRWRGRELGTQTCSGRCVGLGKGWRSVSLCKASSPVLSGVAQVSVQATVGTSAPLPGFCESQLFWNIWHCVQNASCCQGLEVVLVVPSGAGPEMALLS